MSPDRRAALTTGVLFIAGIVTALLSSAIEHPVSTGTGYLIKITQDTGRMSTGGLLEFAEAATGVGIAIAMYPVLRKRSHGLALGSVAFRTIEAAMSAVGAVITLSLAGVARQYAAAPIVSHGAIRSIGDTLTNMRQHAVLAGAFAYIIGALMYYVIFYRSRLVPRWLTVWGIAAEIPLFIGCLLALYHNTDVTSYTFLALPIAVQEIVLAVWLILRGFSPGAGQPGAVSGPRPVGNPNAAQQPAS
jgi:hypothetical protein